MTPVHATPAAPLRLVSLIAVAIVVGGCFGGSPAAATSPSSARTVTPATSSPGSSLVAARSIKPRSTGAQGGSASPTSATPAPGTPTPASPTPTPASPAPSVSTTDPGTVTVAEPTLAQMVGQKLVVRMDSAVPSSSLLGRIRRGEVGGVILFGDDISSESQLKALTAQLHGAAAAGGQPRLLVMTDQEGGLVRRIPWAPPSQSARTMGAGTITNARTQGILTGQALHADGVDVDLAPVADVPRYTSSFMWLDKRTFGFEPTTVSPRANAFAQGLGTGGTVATMKHFPGIGRAAKNTDNYVVSIPATLAALQQRDLVPYRTAIANGIPMIMLSNANYPALDPSHGAGWSRAITKDLLRTQLGFKGVTITDSLSAAARTRGVAGSFLAMESAAAGTDFVLVTGSEASTVGVYNYMLKKAEAHVIGTLTLKASYLRILALKAGL